MNYFEFIRYVAISHIYFLIHRHTNIEFNKCFVRSEELIKIFKFNKYSLYFSGKKSAPKGGDMKATTRVEDMKELKVDLKDVKSVIDSLHLSATRIGSYVILLKSDFDLNISHEPYIALMLLLNLKSGQYFARIWNETIASGIAIKAAQIMEVCRNHFGQGNPCLGVLQKKESNKLEIEYLVSHTPVPRKIAKTCNKFLGKDVERNVRTCADCLKLEVPPKFGNNVLVKTELKSADPTEENEIDMSETIIDHKLSDYKEEYIDDGSIDFDVLAYEAEVKVENGTRILKNQSVKRKPHRRRFIKTRIDGSAECPICHYIVPRAEGGIFRHMKTEHYWGRFQCNQCETKVESAGDLIKHIIAEQNHTEKRLVYCPCCRKGRHVKDFQSHYEKCVKANCKKTECLDCGKSVYNIVKHKRKLCPNREKKNKTDASKTNIKVANKCPWCPSVFNFVGNFTRHKKVKHFWGQFMCRQCDSQAEFASDLVKHIKEQSHMEDPLTDCPHCKSSVHYGDIQSHYEVCISKYNEAILKTGKDAQKKVLTCTICGKMLTGYNSMKAHEKIHMREKGVTDFCHCDKCGKKFVSRESLSKHIKNVHELVPRTCPVCGLTFEGTSKMLYHKRKEHNFLQCEHCDYTCEAKYKLDMHMAKHFAPKFKCSYCEKMLKSKISLEAHEREHTGDRPFECKTCGKGFKSATTLLTHTKHVHKILTPRMKPIVPRVRNK